MGKAFLNFTHRPETTQKNTDSKSKWYSKQKKRKTL